LRMEWSYISVMRNGGEARRKGREKEKGTVLRTGADAVDFKQNS